MILTRKVCSTRSSRAINVVEPTTPGLIESTGSRISGEVAEDRRFVTSGTMDLTPMVEENITGGQV